VVWSANRKKNVHLAITLPAIFVLLGVAPHVQAEAGWKAGVAKAVITPRGSIWMAGFAARNRPSEGIQTDLHVKALALQDETGKNSAFVTSDLIGFRRELSDAIAGRCEKRFGVTRDRLVLNSSHTHSGPVIGRGWGTRSPEQERVIQAYTEELLEKVVEVVGKSIQDLSPATLEFKQGLAGFAVNRRRDRPGMRHLPGPVDHDAPVLSVRSPDGQLRAILFGYACHNTTLAGYHINADYAGYAQEALEKAHPGAMALFLQGCGGDQNPLPRYHGFEPQLSHYSVELCSMYGRILAAAVDLVLHEKMTPVSGPLTTTFERVDIPFQPLPTRDELQARLKDSDSDLRARAERVLGILERQGSLPDRYPYPIQVAQFGRSLKFIALGGEPVVDYALRLKAEHGWENTWVAGYCNDVFAYIPSKRVLKEGGYETGGGPGGPFSVAVEEIIVEKINELVRRTRNGTGPIR